MFSQITALHVRFRTRIAFVYCALCILSGCEAAYPDGRYVCGDGNLCPRGFECVVSENLCYQKAGEIDEGGGFENAGANGFIKGYVDPCEGKGAYEMVCDGRTLTQCDENGGVYASDLCDSNAMCLAGTRGFGCGQCEPDSYACEGKTLQRCDQTGQYSPTAIGKFDNLTACKEELKKLGGACKVGQVKCITDVLYVCNQDQTAFNEDLSVAQCEIGFCNESLGKCNLCRPGWVTCNKKGDGIITCSDDGQRTTVTACDKSTPVCIDGVCG